MAEEPVFFTVWWLCLHRGQIGLHRASFHTLAEKKAFQIKMKMSESTCLFLSSSSELAVAMNESNVFNIPELLLYRLACPDFGEPIA